MTPSPHAAPAAPAAADAGPAGERALGGGRFDERFLRKLESFRQEMLSWRRDWRKRYRANEGFGKRIERQLKNAKGAPTRQTTKPDRKSPLPSPE